MINEILLGAGVGIALGLTGSGGVLAVPALMLGLGFTLQEAAPVSLIAIGMGSLIGTIDGLRRGLVRYRAALVMAGFGTLAAPLGIHLSHILPITLLTILFSLLLLMIAVKMVRQARKNQLATEDDHKLAQNCMLRPDTGRFQWNPKCFSTLAGIGALSGLSSGLLGVGGGFLIVPGVQHFSNLGMHGIVATSLAVITLISGGTVVHSLMAGAEITAQGWWFIGATSVGLLAGRVAAPKLPARVLQLSFAVLAAVVSVMMMYKYLLPVLLG
ncbi:sulfite exporter TauE/SafE family protein [Oceanobacter mangrovi]|uniref:sulfite exporter TauE/SafE family protein n=1 Tax=Oceanobacter mangrovi TaxID=2862510 RepID=UPI001C8E74EC|nr:sulfite exporter TauE/SafE family protein [Oceanobacter mangrovi]